MAGNDVTQHSDIPAGTQRNSRVQGMVRLLSQYLACPCGFSTSTPPVLRAERCSSARLECDEIALGILLRRLTLEADHELEIKGVCDSLQRIDTRRMPAALDPGDLRVAGADSVGELLLGEVVLHPVLDDEPGNLPEPLTGISLSAVRRAALGPAPACHRCRCADGAEVLVSLSRLVLDHDINLSPLISCGETAAIHARNQGSVDVGV
jgi:hypothetical protein